jgi:fatty-acyl-CoA synthase
MNRREKNMPDTSTVLPQTLGDVARQQARARSNDIAYSFEGRATTFAEFDRHASQIANGLIEEGIDPGARIAYLGKNSDHYFEILFGAAKAGVVMTPVNWRLAPPEIVYILSDCKAQILFVGSEFTALVRSIANDLPAMKRFITMEGGVPEWQSYEAWRDTQPARDPQCAVAREDVAIQLYTSGTTGRPKGAMLKHAGILGPRQAFAADAPEWNKWAADDIGLVAMPVFHIGGTGFGITTLVNGAKGVVAREFDPNRVLDFIEQDRISKFFMVPAAMQIVVRHP